MTRPCPHADPEWCDCDRLGNLLANIFWWACVPVAAVVAVLLLSGCAVPQPWEYTVTSAGSTIPPECRRDLRQTVQITFKDEKRKNLEDIYKMTGHALPSGYTVNALTWCTPTSGCNALIADDLRGWVRDETEHWERCRARPQGAAGHSARWDGD